MKRLLNISALIFLASLQLSPEALAAAEEKEQWETMNSISRELKQVNSNWPSNNLYLWIDELNDDSLAIGDRFTLRAESESPGYITYLYYDAEGSGVLMFGGEPTSISEGRYRYQFPQLGNSLEVDEPAGRSTVVAFLSEMKPSLPSLGFQDNQKMALVEDTAERVQRIAQWMSENQKNRVAVKSTRYFVEQPGQSNSSRTRKLLAVLVDPNAPPLEVGTSTSVTVTNDSIESTSDSLGTQPEATAENVQLEDERLLEKARLGGDTFEQHIYFKTGSSILSDEGKRQLDDWAEVLAELPEARKLVLIGHTDSRGSSEYNQRLSEQRAESARAYLVLDKNINATRVKAWGLGEEQPIAPNDNPGMWQKNRRVEFVVH